VWNEVLRLILPENRPYEVYLRYESVCLTTPHLRDRFWMGRQPGSYPENCDLMVSRHEYCQSGRQFDRRILPPTRRRRLHAAAGISGRRSSNSKRCGKGSARGMVWRSSLEITRQYSHARACREMRKTTKHATLRRLFREF